MREKLKDICNTMIMILVRLSIQPNGAVILQIYMPTTQDEDKKVKTLYEELDNLIDIIKCEGNLLILGDWNTIVGEEKDGNPIGCFGLGEIN